jgi:hypothetical protein
MKIKKKTRIYKIYKFIIDKISPRTLEEIEYEYSLKYYFIYLDYLQGRSLDKNTGKVNPLFNNEELEELYKIEFYLSPAARSLIHNSATADL